MSTQVLIAFKVRLKSKARNIISSAIIVSETDVDAIETMKAETLMHLTNFVNANRRNEPKYIPPQEFWKDVEVSATPLKVGVLNFEYERLTNTLPFKLY